jgi:hypothetical protein
LILINSATIFDVCVLEVLLVGVLLNIGTGIMASAENKAEQSTSHEPLTELSHNTRSSANHTSDHLEASSLDVTSPNPKSKNEKEALQLQKIYSGKPEQLINLLRFQHFIPIQYSVWPIGNVYLSRHC